MARFEFHLEKGNTNARAGSVHFSGSESSGVTVLTPSFMPVGTRGSVKALTQEHLEELGYNLILGNTYHLYLRPGNAVLKKMGGLKKFMSWNGALLTDSGGYQAFSLSKLTQYTDSGIWFSSHIDGSKHFFSPQSVLDTQAIIGSDIVMPIDDCAPYPSSPERLASALKRTHEWLRLSKEHWVSKGYLQEQSLFGIVQGGVDEKLRKESAQYCAQLDLPGYAIGGLSVGEKNDEFRTALNAATCELPMAKPRYLMGVGSIPEILDAVKMGVDLFDCVLPTRNARNGQVFTTQGKVNLRNEKHSDDDRPIDIHCGCRVCRRYSIGYIRHLHKTKELLAYTLSTYHNLYFMNWFMQNLRSAILENRFSEFYNRWRALF